jgi:hypothetical protein
VPPTIPLRDLRAAGYALKVDAALAANLSFLDTLQPDTLAGLLLGVFPSFRAGNEPPEQVYRDVLQTPERADARLR